ncbi:hypothetical protein [Micromonospora arborensis]|uniref:hypothetical protein n=1 Tax=Micromonospora arborensis TaxID=2116518 RepID=UPI003722B637
MTAPTTRAPITPPTGQTWTFDAAALSAAVERRRRDLRISRREVIRQTGGGTPSTLTRLDDGHHISVDVFLRLLMWLGCTDAEPFITAAPARDEGAVDA